MLGGAVVIALFHFGHGSPDRQVRLIAPIALVGGLLLLLLSPFGRMSGAEGLDLAAEQFARSARA